MCCRHDCVLSSWLWVMWYCHGGSSCWIMLPRGFNYLSLLSWLLVGLWLTLLQLVYSEVSGVLWLLSLCLVCLHGSAIMACLLLPCLWVVLLWRWFLQLWLFCCHCGFGYKLLVVSWLESLLLCGWLVGGRFAWLVGWNEGGWSRPSS